MTDLLAAALGIGLLACVCALAFYYARRLVRLEDEQHELRHLVLRIARITGVGAALDRDDEGRLWDDLH